MFTFNRLYLKISLISFILICLNLISCTFANRSGTLHQLDSKHIANIKKLCIIVKKENDFKMMYAGERHSGWGGIHEASVRDYYDEESTKEMRTKLGNLDPQLSIQENLFEYLNKAETFNEIISIDNISPSTMKENKIDVVLKITIKEWGLRRGMRRNEIKTQVIFDIMANMVKVDTSKILWKFNYLYFDSEKYLIETFLSHPGLFEKVITKATMKISERIYNEIIYSQY